MGELTTDCFVEECKAKDQCFTGMNPVKFTFTLTQDDLNSFKVGY